jgi:hypothetical protein
MKTNQKIISASFYIESGEFNIPTLILEIFENGKIKKNKYEFQKYIEKREEFNCLISYIAMVYFNDEVSIGITKSDSHVLLYYNSEKPVATLERTDDNRFLYGKILEEYKEEIKIEEKKKNTNFFSEVIMYKLNIKTYTETPSFFFKK